MRAFATDRAPASAANAPASELLAGPVERVTFHNAENGFCVLRVKARGHRDLVTVVGHAASVSAGEWLTATGNWVNDRQHGPQFKARFLRTSAPTTAEGIERYLASGMIRGIGPVYAKKLVAAFREAVFDVIERAPERLRKVSGIGPMRAERIVRAWADQKVIREIMVFLHGHGVGTSRAVRIFKTYGVDAVQVMSENPYRLARDIRGIGFKTADAIAMRLGVEPTAMIRVRAGISHALSEAMEEGIAACRRRSSAASRPSFSGSSRSWSRPRSRWNSRTARSSPTWWATGAACFSPVCMPPNAASPPACGR